MKPPNTRLTCIKAGQCRRGVYRRRGRPCGDATRTAWTRGRGPSCAQQQTPGPRARLEILLRESSDS